MSFFWRNLFTYFKTKTFIINWKYEFYSIHFGLVGEYEGEKLVVESYRRRKLSTVLRGECTRPHQPPQPSAQEAPLVILSTFHMPCCSSSGPWTHFLLLPRPASSLSFKIAYNLDPTPSNTLSQHHPRLSFYTNQCLSPLQHSIESMFSSVFSIILSQGTKLKNE